MTGIRKNHAWASAAALVMPLLLAVCYALLALTPDLRYAVPEALGLTAVATIIVSILYYGVHKGWARWSPVTILIVAAGLRLLFLFHTPQLSDDIYRYLFDGSQTLAGNNPYALSPEQAAQENLSLSLLAAKVNHPHLVTIYPPGAQFIFAIGALGGDILSVKLVLIVADLLCIFLMMRLMNYLGREPDQVLLYAWHPLGVLEIAASGHIDGVAVMFVCAAVCLLWPHSCSPRREPQLGKGSGAAGKGTCRRSQHLGAVFCSGFLFAFAILVKLFPIVFFPFCLLFGGAKHRLVLGIGLTVGLVVLVFPFYSGIWNVVGTLGIYAAYWEFSGLMFGLLRHWLDSGLWARILLGGVFATIWIYFWIAAQRMKANHIVSSRELLAVVLQAIYSLSFVFLLVTPTLYPWYGLYMLGFLPFAPNPSGMILSWSILLGYRVLIPYHILGQWTAGHADAILIWSGPLIALLVSFLRRYVKRSSFF